jgi:hypothetical protein
MNALPFIISATDLAGNSDCYMHCNGQTARFGDTVVAIPSTCCKFLSAEYTARSSRFYPNHMLCMPIYAHVDQLVKLYSVKVISYFHVNPSFLSAFVEEIRDQSIDVKSEVTDNLSYWQFILHINYTVVKKKTISLPCAGTGLCEGIIIAPLHASRRSIPAGLHEPILGLID